MDLVDTGFVLICSALVFLMTPGLAFFYGGLVGRHNTLTIMAQNLISLGLVSVVWIVIGFSLAFGDTVGGIIGDLKYWLFRIPVDEVFSGTTIPTWTFFLFQMMFAVITPALITGAFVDRFRFSSYLIFICIWSVLVYSVLAHWVWGGGLLAKLGAIDFAGGTVVHISAGMAALATVTVLGARRTHTPPHDIRFVALGTALLWFGWFGFNGGSALSPNEIASVAFINTDISASTAMVTWMLLSWRHKGKPSIIGALTGAIAGLIAITPAAGFVTPGWAALIGVLAGASVLRRGAVQGEDGLGRRPRRVGRARRGRHPRLDPHRHVRDPGDRLRGPGVRRREPVLRQPGRHRDQRGVRIRDDLAHPQSARRLQAPEAGNRRAGSGPRPHLPRRTRPRPRLTRAKSSGSSTLTGSSLRVLRSAACSRRSRVE